MSFNSDGSLLWFKQVGVPVNALTAADIDDDGEVELILSTKDGIRVMTSTGQPLWNFTTCGSVDSEAVVLDSVGNPYKEVIFGAGDGSIYGIDSDGKRLWNYDTLATSFSTPSVFDLDSDGVDELAFQGDDQRLYILPYPPQKVWLYQTYAYPSSTPTPLVPKGRGDTQVVFGSVRGELSSVYVADMADEDIQRSCTAEGCVREGVPTTKLREKWRNKVGEKALSSQAVADLDGDGLAEIIYGDHDHNLYILNASGYRLLRYTTDSPVMSSPLVADLDKDGRYEIVVTSSKGTLYILEPSGLTIYSHYIGEKVESTPAIADVDRNGQLEIVVTTKDGNIYVFGFDETARYR